MRSVTALLVDVPASHAAQIARAVPEVRTVPVSGEEALNAALQRRGWDAVLYGGGGPHAVPGQKALALVRLADPHLPFIVVSPLTRTAGVPSVSTLSQLAPVLTRELEQARMRRRVGGAHKLLSAQQAIADHLAAGLEPVALCERVLATLGESLGWAAGAVWRPDGARLTCITAWHAADSRAGVAALTNASRDRTYAAGQGLPGRVWGFRRLIWAEAPEERAARRPGDRGRVPDLRRRRVRRRDRALRHRRPRAERRGRGDVRHDRRPARRLPHPPPAPRVRRRGRADRGGGRRGPRGDRRTARPAPPSASPSRSCSAAACPTRRTSAGAGPTAATRTAR